MNQHYTPTRNSNIFPKRLLLVLAVILMGLQGLKAQTANNAYIFYNATYGYLINNGNPGVSTTFNKNAIWVASGDLPNNGNTSRNIYSYLDINNNTKSTYLTRSGTSLGFANAASTYWRTSNNSLRYRASNTNNYYLKYTGTAFDLSSTANNGDRFTVTGITITENNSTPSTPTISITAASGLSNGGIQLTGNVTGSYVPTYYSATVRNQTYYWTTTTDASTTQPTGITDWSDAAITWDVTTGGGYASVDGNGLVTITGNPTGNIVVRMDVSKGDYSGYTTITLTRATPGQSTSSVSTINSFSVSPGSAGLYEDESQTFTASATVNNTTYTTPAHITLTGGGNTYYYYNGTLYTSTEDFSSSSTTTATPSFAWSMTGAGSSNASLSTTSGASTTLTHTPGVSTDKPLTLTVEASYTGATSQTRSAQVNLYAPFVAPTITRSGNNVILSTTSLGATIYYTIDGSTPSAANGTAYTAPINLESLTLPVTIKAIAVRGGESTSVAEQEFTSLAVEKPVIVISSTGAVTITCATSGASIRYTTDGTAPTSTSGTVYSDSFTVTNLTTVKAIAYKTGYADSEIASEQYITSGVNGTTVILNDREDHSWSYYSDGSTPSQLHSLNPADVKITYYGDGIMMTGDADYTASSTDFVQPGNANYVGGAKVNVGGEDENTFVYYKTLERANADGSGRCPYTPIYNPFQVRPTYGTRGSTDANDFTGWRGFQCWRLKSVTGGALYVAASGGTALSTGAVINAETEIYFAPNGEYGMEVELEAVWARAYVKKADQANENPVGTNNVGYERNFCVPTTGAGYTLYTGTGKRITNANHIPVTISCYYPDGTAPDNTNNSISNTAFALTADTKFENIPINLTSNTVTLANYDIIVGRGCGSSTINNLQGINAAATDLDYTIRLESGTYNQFCFVRNGTNTTVSGRYLIKAIMGSDYDRATNTNNKLSVSPNSTLFFAQTVGFTGSSNKDQKTFDCVFKSGRYQSEQWNGSIQSGQNGYQHIAYLGQNSAQGNTYPGVRYVTVEGGEFSGMCGGRGVGGNSVDAMTPEVITFDLRIKGGTFHGAVYGGAADNPSIGSRRFIITGGEIQSWIAGGCNGTGSTSGTGATDGDSYIYVGGTTLVGGDNPIVINETNGGQVFGAGRGISGRASSVNHSHVAIADEAVVCNNNNNSSYPVGGNVYGGSYNGTIADVSNVYILGGRVEGSAFGGSYGNGTAIPEANVTMTGGLVTNGVYGGSNSTGTVNNVIMHIDGGQVGTSSANANVHGGGYGQATIVAQNVDVTVGTTTQTTPGVTVYGDVYGGSALGRVNGTAATNTYHTYVTLNKGTINGSLYGGALGDASTAANVYGPVAVKVYGGSVNTTSADGSGAVYGCNNINGAPQNTVTVDIYGTDPAPDADHYALDAVYGGGNKASYAAGTPVVTVHNCNNSIGYVYGGGNAAHITNGNTDVTIYGGNKIGNVFGGGNGTVTAANVSGNTNVKIYGGTILHVFGGSNSQGNIGNTINVTVNKQADTDLNGSSTACDMKIGELYGGGNLAASNAGSITIGCTGSLTADHSTHPENIGTSLEGIGTVYGGANQANITGDITLTMNSGMVGNLFGGNNTSGTISGGIQVNIEKNNSATCASDWYVGNVFGGGNLAQYTGSPAVNILNGTVSGNVYGGGKGDPNNHTMGQVTGAPVVTIGDNVNGHQVTVRGSVFGGGDAGNVVGTPVVNVVEKCNTVINTGVYGGGNAADVTATDVRIYGGTIGDVFGGGNGQVAAANVTNTTNVAIHGGTITRAFAGSNTSGTIGGAASITIDHTSSCAQSVSEVYGGGNLAAGNAGTVTIQCTAENIGDVYGGANQADIGTSGSPSNITLNINGGQINNVFGGNNTSGSIYGTITVNVNKDPSCNTFSVNNVFGGGNLAEYTGSPTVTLTNGTVSHSVFGGGNEAGVGGSTVNINGGQVVDGVYGGCNTSGTVTGAIAVNINGGTLGTSSTRMTNGIFGGGYGVSTETEGNVTVTIGDAAGTYTPTIYADIYGGSALGSVNDATAELTTVNIFNGTVNGNVYGGGLGAATLDEHGYIASVTTEAIVNGTVHVNIGDASNTNSTPTINGKVFGCNNLAGSPKGNVYVDVYRTAHTTANTYPSEPASASAIPDNPVPNSFAISEVYGGGNLAHYTTTLSGASTHVRIHNCDNTIQYVYGGGNAANTVANDVTIDGGRFEYIFGGGNGAGTGNPGANVDGNATVHINGGIINYTFGGSNTLGVVHGVSSMTFADSPTCTRMVKELYGGGNKAPGGTVEMTIPCGVSGLNVVFGGSRMADIGSETEFNNGEKKNVTLTIEGGELTQVFGGNNLGGTIWGDVTLNLKGGTIVDAFGGNNAGGNVKGTITVNVEDAEDSTCPLILTNVFGGGKDAAYTPADATISSPLVYIKHKKSGTSITGSVFGGGQGATATVTAKPVVTIGDLTTSSYIATIGGDVYGGGDAADVVGSTTVLVQKCNTVINGDVYGGGNAADVDATSVTITGGTITGTGHGMVFGGGHGDLASLGTPHTDKVANVNGNVAVVINGGTINKVFAGSNLNGTISGTTSVNVDKSTASGACALKIGEVYGGGNVAAGNAGTITIGCTGTLVALGTGEHYGVDQEGITYVYGGANQADINNDIEVNIISGIVENVFGGNNTSGDINGTITVNIEKDASASCASNWYVGNVFGGGNQATYGSTTTPAGDYPEVNILNGLVSGDVFGGGLGLSGDPTKGVVTGNPQVTVNGSGASVNGGVYGGGSLAPTVGNPLVTLTTGALTKVFGGGKAADVTGAPTVNINGGTVSTGVYGGCDSQGNVTGKITVNVTNGTIGDPSINLTTPDYITADVYGGGYGQNTTTTGNVEVNFGTTATSHNDFPKLYGNIYGGSALGNVNKDANNTTIVNILNGTLYTTATTGTTTNGQTYYVYHGGNVFGGGLGDRANLGTGHSNVAAQVKGKVTVNIGSASNTKVLNPDEDLNGGFAIIQGNVYGSNNTNGSPQDDVTVNIYRTERGEKDQITYTGNDATYALNNVFGGGNEADYTASGKTASVNIFGCYNSIYRVFGGGNAAAAPNVHTTIQGGRFAEVFGGGNGERGAAYAANITGNVNLEIHGGIVGEFYVGSNQNGAISGTSSVVVDQTSGCEEVSITEFYCGGKYADFVGNIEATITCSQNMNVTNLYGGCKEANVVDWPVGHANHGSGGNVHLIVKGGTYENVYGGSRGERGGKAADIEGNVTLDLYGGTIENVYGGSNENGNIAGTITVNIIDEEGNCPLIITNIYGGSNETDYTPTNPSAISPVVNVIHINNDVQGNVYGGSRGISGATTPTKVVSCPQVNIGYNSSMTGLPSTQTYNPANYSLKTTIQGNVYGGGDAAKVKGNTAVFLREKAKVVGNVYGGGNMAEVEGDTKVIVNGANQ